MLLYIHIHILEKEGRHLQNMILSPESSKAFFSPAKKYAYPILYVPSSRSSSLGDWKWWVFHSTVTTEYIMIHYDRAACIVNIIVPAQTIVNISCYNLYW